MVVRILDIKIRLLDKMCMTSILYLYGGREGR